MHKSMMVANAKYRRAVFVQCQWRVEDDDKLDNNKDKSNKMVEAKLM